MVSTGRITSLIALCLVSTIACGFSSWIYVENNKADAGIVDVNVGNITSNSSATIIFKKAELFTFGKYGFAHEEEIIIDGKPKTITYFDYNYSISSLWEINTKDNQAFTYEIGEDHNQTFDFLLNSGKLTIAAYSNYDGDTGLLSNPITGASSTFSKYTKLSSITYNLSLSKSDAYQYVKIDYQNTASIPEGSDFNTTVFTPATTAIDFRGDVQVVTFSFNLNKVVS